MRIYCVVSIFWNSLPTISVGFSALGVSKSELTTLLLTADAGNFEKNRPVSASSDDLRQPPQTATSRKPISIKDIAFRTGFDLGPKKTEKERLQDGENQWFGEVLWLNIFDEIKQRGVRKIYFASADGLTGIAEAVRSAFGESTIFRRFFNDASLTSSGTA